MADKAILPKQAENFSEWYLTLLEKAQLADNGPVRGTVIIRPTAYAVWERMQTELDDRIKAAGVSNAYFPLLIPESYFHKEAEHIEGFSPELALVTVAGGKPLEEPLAIRPTSETVIGEAMARWVQSHRDLPLLLNQWANVVRWELRPRTFLRNTEFLWQEGHTAHSSAEDARRFSETILEYVYADFIENVLRIPVIRGVKTRREKFAGAVRTLTVEAIMRDGKALQMGTSHQLGQNFATAFNIGFSDESGVRQHAFTTSWGVSTRLLGGLIMSHGDDHGLRLPMGIAPTQVVIVPVGDLADSSVVRGLESALRDRGVRVAIDDKTHQAFGRRVTDWELKGVPHRIEFGAREAAEGAVTVYDRFDRTRETIPVDGLLQSIRDGEWPPDSDALFREARARMSNAITLVDSVDGAIAASKTGFAKLPPELLTEEAEDRINDSGASVRCLTSETHSLPLGGEPTFAIVARAY